MFDTNSRQISIASILISSLVLTACGGDGGDSGTANTPPVAVNDTFAVNEGGTLAITAGNDILVNDSDAENNTLVAILLNDVSAGVLSLNSDGTLSYTHTGGAATTSDSFTYQANDGTDNSNVATVTININPPGSPVANADAYNGLSEGGTLTVTAVNGVLANDSDPENDTLTAILVASPSFASSFFFNNDGTFSYTHDGTENLNDSFSYKAFDGQLNSSTVTVSISVSAINDVPVANDDSYIINQGSVLNITNANNGVLGNDQDPDSLLTATVVAGPSFASSFFFNNDGTFSYTHDGSANYIDSFTYQANDASNASNPATVTIALNHPIALSSCSTTAQESAIGGTLQVINVDGSLLTFSLGADGSDGSGPMTTTRGSVVITNSTTGAYTYTPSATGLRGTDSFDFFVEDPDGGSASATETIIIDQKIMPLGNSITRGTENTSPSIPADDLKVGYRKLLYDSLIAAGYSFDYVGSDALAGSGVADFDSDNEGHSGWTAAQIASGIGAWLALNPADVVLLHIGTNDGPVPGSTEIDTEAILDEIDLWENSASGNPVTVILAKIVNQDPFTVDVTSYNTAIEAMALSRVGDDVIIVDMETALSYPADLGDSVHPNAGGYAKMAPVWHTDLVPVLDKCP